MGSCLWEFVWNAAQGTDGKDGTGHRRASRNRRPRCPFGKEKFEDGVYIFILPPSFDTLRTRLQNRAGDSPEEIQRRLQKAKEEVWSYREYYYIVRNDDLKQSLKELESIFLAERTKTKRLNMTWLEEKFILDKEGKPGNAAPAPASKEQPNHG
ncbi:MAG: hypothetical protein MRJ92_10280 [Nitrospira sp.]|nr:hypothetical protein [Nitrospira sp.]